jgi:hypothetical protein
MESITKVVECNENPTEIIMNRMMRPCSQEELDAMIYDMDLLFACVVAAVAYSVVKLKGKNK